MRSAEHQRWALRPCQKLGHRSPTGDRGHTGYFTCTGCGSTLAEVREAHPLGQGTRWNHFLWRDGVSVPREPSAAPRPSPRRPSPLHFKRLGVGSLYKSLNNWDLRLRKSCASFRGLDCPRPACRHIHASLGNVLPIDPYITVLLGFITLATSCLSCGTGLGH